MNGNHFTQIFVSKLARTMKMSKPPNTDSTNQSQLSFWQRKWVKNLLFALFLVILYITLRPFMQGDVVQGPAPAFETESITGEPIRLADYRGQPVMVHFWATWCPICQLERDSVERLSEDYPVINIATQSMDDDGLLAFAKEHNMNPNQIVNDFDGQLMKAFGARAVPASFIIGPDGDVSFVEVGYTTPYGLRARLWWLQ